MEHPSDDWTTEQLLSYSNTFAQLEMWKVTTENSDVHISLWHCLIEHGDDEEDMGIWMPACVDTGNEHSIIAFSHFVYRHATRMSKAV